MAATYSADNISNLQYPHNVRHTPSQFIGDTSDGGYTTIAREPLDNAVDEALAGRATECWFHVQGDRKNQVFTICDDGHGIPTEMKTIDVALTGTKIKMPAIQLVCSVPASSGKFNDTAYKVSRGVHGLGIKCTNALSVYFEVFTFYNKKWQCITFKRGELDEPLRPCEAPVNPVTGKVMTRGTMIRYKPDTTIFKDAKLLFPVISQWADVAAYFTPALKIHLSANGRTKSIHFPNGVLDYMNNRLAALEAKRIDPTGAHDFIYNSPLADVALTFADSTDCDMKAYTNGLFNSSGGDHYNVVLRALFKALYSLKAKKQEFTQLDIRDGVVGIINAKMSSPQFSSQTKERLTDARCKEMVEPIEEAILAFLKKHKALTEVLIERACRVSSAREAYSATRALAKTLKGMKSVGMPAKYAAYDSDVPVEFRRLYLVEGDSASGSCKIARNAGDAILPLRGKILNVLKSNDTKSLQSNEIPLIINALGIDLKADDPYAKLAVGRVVILTDKDDSGEHISTLLLAFFYKYLPELIRRGMVYQCDSYEYYSIHKGKLSLGNSLSELKAENERKGFPASTPCNHIKGWGEASPPVLKVIAFDPENSRMLRIEWPDSHADEQAFVSLMHSSAEARRALVGVTELAKAKDKPKPVKVTTPPPKKTAAKAAPKKTSHGEF